MMEIYWHTRGKWEIDRIWGKAVLVIKVTENGTSAEDAPTHSAIYELLDKMLEVELYNDSFTFRNPVLDEHRPTEIFKKIREIKKRLLYWDGKAKEVIYGKQVPML